MLNDMLNRPYLESRICKATLGLCHSLTTYYFDYLSNFPPSLINHEPHEIREHLLHPLLKSLYLTQCSSSCKHLIDGFWKSATSVFLAKLIGSYPRNDWGGGGGEKEKSWTCRFQAKFTLSILSFRKFCMFTNPTNKFHILKTYPFTSKKCLKYQDAHHGVLELEEKTNTRKISCCPKALTPGRCNPTLHFRSIKLDILTTFLSPKLFFII